MKDVETCGEIWRMEVDTDDPDCDLYYFDHEMRLTDVVCCFHRAEKDALDRNAAEDFFLLLSVPFKAGEWVKTVKPFEERQYGLIEVDAMEFLESMLSNHAARDSSDMCMPVKVYDDMTQGFKHMQHIPYTDLDYCTKEEIKKVLRK